MSGSRGWFIAAAVCFVLNIVLVLTPSDALNAIGGLLLIVAVGLALRGAWVHIQSRRAAPPQDL